MCFTASALPLSANAIEVKDNSVSATVLFGSIIINEQINLLRHILWKQVNCQNRHWSNWIFPIIISNYESGKTYPKKREIYDTLATILDISADYLRNENEEFITEATEKYGNRGKQQADQLVKQLGGLFAGGELSDSEMDGVMRALPVSYTHLTLPTKA